CLRLLGFYCYFVDLAYSLLFFKQGLMASMSLTPTLPVNWKPSSGGTPPKRQESTSNLASTP
ncbi:hypothetical protein AALA83_15030, partial [Oscillospiraceae bacterium 44-5]